MTESLVATESDITPDNSAYRDASTGFSLVEGAGDVRTAIDEGNWVDASIAGIGLAIEGAAIAIDPFSTLLAMGIEWAMEQIEPLKEALDWLAGNPQAVETHALTWDNMSAELLSISEDLGRRLEGDLQGWQDDAADAYRTMLGANADLVAALSGTAAGMASATRGAGTLVSMIREFVRGFIADCVAKVVVWLAEVVFSVGLATPVVASQMAAAVVKWSARIFGWLMGLVTSIQSLRALLDI
ncbi:hypothetical protein GCM10009830_14840 [Glycomyces endophyticus]|uniref:WXG100 family type VII secretion target n=1 Tax=Glycomyces endophyticus TaxID=480996 RepID=A0ABP4SDI5_9ACTN